MKITLPITALAAILGLALAGIPVTVHAQTAPAAPAATAKTAGPKKTRYMGTLSAIDTAANTITITDKTVGPKTISITATTKIKKDSKVATLTDFKVGDKVSGSFTADATGKMEAATLNSGASAKKASKTAATPAAQ